LLFASRSRKAEVVVLVGGKVVARRKARPARQLKLGRVALDLSKHRGQTATIEVRDRDPKGEIVIDDLRWSD